MISAAVDAQLDVQGLQFLQDIGIETASDLANLWTSEYQILEATSEASLLQQLTRAWQAASVQESIRLVPAATLVHVPSVPQGAKPKNRAVPPASLLPAAYRFRIKPAVVANPLQVADKRAPLLDLMFELALAPGPENIVFGKDVVAYQLEAKPIFERKLQTVQTDALDAHKRALKRCIAYHAQHCPAEMPYWRPDARGPTAAAGVYMSLKWMREKIGLPLPVQDALVQHWSIVDVNHCCKPQLPLPVQAFLALLRAAPALKGRLKSAAAWTFLLLAACLRFKHVQRSYDLIIDGPLLRGTCFKGKRRVGHVRPPFRWALPARIGGFDLGQQLLVDWNERLLEEPGARYIIPDLDIGLRHPLQPATCTKPGPMSIAKFAKMAQALLQAVCPQLVEGVQITSYSFRRFLPTAADSLLLPEI